MLKTVNEGFRVVEFEIIWMRIGEIIKLRNDINFSEIPYTSQMIKKI